MSQKKRSLLLRYGFPVSLARNMRSRGPKDGGVKYKRASQVCSAFCLLCLSRTSRSFSFSAVFWVITTGIAFLYLYSFLIWYHFLFFFPRQVPHFPINHEAFCMQCSCSALSSLSCWSTANLYGCSRASSRSRTSWNSCIANYRNTNSQSRQMLPLSSVTLRPKTSALVMTRVMSC